MIDTHCHLDSERFEADRPQVLARAWAAGVAGLVVPAVGPDGWEALLELPGGDVRLQVGLGIHPQLLPSLSPRDDVGHLERLDVLLGRGVAAAVGECGLDGPSVEAGAPLARQLAVLEGHFALACKHRLPVLLHCYRVQPALVDFLKARPFPEAGVLLHSYSGGTDLVRFYTRRGCYFSFAGPVSYPEARKPHDAVRAVPPERLVVETDAPDQAPHPYRGQRSEPAYLPHILEGMARALGKPVEEVAELTAANARRLFGRAFLAGVP